MKTVQKYYVVDISETQLINAATQGMLAKATVTKNVRKAIDNIPNQPSKTGSPPGYAELQRFYRAMKLIQSVDPVSDAEAFEDAHERNARISGILNSLDPDGRDLYKELQVERKGQFAGLGVEITFQNGILIVVSPLRTHQRSGRACNQGTRSSTEMGSQLRA